MKVKEVLAGRSGSWEGIGSGLRGWENLPLKYQGPVGGRCRYTKSYSSETVWGRDLRGLLLAVPSLLRQPDSTGPSRFAEHTKEYKDEQVECSPE